MKVEYKPVAKDDLEKIASYLPYFSQKESFGEWKGLESDNGTFHMPYVDYSGKVNAFKKLLYTSNFIVVFDWGNWDKGKVLTEHREQITHTDLLTLRMLTTAIVRNDRFCEGAFLSAAQDGLIATILKRLEELNKENKTNMKEGDNQYAT